MGNLEEVCPTKNRRSKKERSIEGRKNGRDVIVPMTEKKGSQTKTSPDGKEEFSSRWYLRDRESVYELHPVPPSFPNVTFETIPVLV